MEDYFHTETSRAVVRQPLLATETADKFDVLVLANGGGFTGQAGAARLGDRAWRRLLDEFRSVVRGELDPAAALALMQRDTVRYARRQMTWFTREPGIEWLEVAASTPPETIADRIVRRLTPLTREGALN